MSLIPLGFWAASGGAAAGATSFDLLATEILASSQSSVTFSSLDTLAAGYQHLQIRATVKYADGFDNFYMRFNGDSGSNYSHHRLVGNGSSVTSVASTSQTNLIGGVGAGTTSGVFAFSVTDILDAFESSKNTTIRNFHGDTVAPTIRMTSGAWYNTAALTSIALLAEGSRSFVTGSRFSLYGLKGA